MKANTARRADDTLEASASAGARCSVAWKAEADRSDGGRGRQSLRHTRVFPRSPNGQTPIGWS